MEGGSVTRVAVAVDEEAAVCCYSDDNDDNNNTASVDQEGWNIDMVVDGGGYDVGCKLRWTVMVYGGKLWQSKCKQVRTYDVGLSETNLNGSFLFYIDTKEDCDTNTYRLVHLSNNNVGRRAE